MTLMALTDKAEIQEAVHRLGVTLRRGATQPYLVIESPGFGGTWDKPEPVIWHQHLELWAFLGIESAETRYWCCFGVVSPAVKPKQTPVVEVNSPIEGRNFRAQGAFARDPKGKIYYLHHGSVHRGALTARGTPEPHPRASRTRFVESGLWKGERPVVMWPDGASREMFVLGQLDHETLAPTLAAYVHAALQFRLLMGQKRPVRAKRTVFLSHSNADTDKQWCDEFVSVLRARGREVWYDQLSLMPCVLAEQLTREIAAHDGFVLALSRNALGSPYVRQEIDWALALWRERQQPNILPIRLDDCEMPADLGTYAYVRDAGDTPMRPSEAAQRVDQMLSNWERTA